MIYCSHCNTGNRDGSKFCNACGQPLPEPEPFDTRPPETHGSTGPEGGIPASDEEAVERLAETEPPTDIEQSAEAQPPDDKRSRGSELGVGPEISERDRWQPEPADHQPRDEDVPVEESPDLEALLVSEPPPEVLADIQSSLPIARVVAQRHRPSSWPTLSPVPEELEQAGLFQEMLTARPEAPPVEGGERWPRWRAWAGPRLIYLLIAVSVIVPFFVIRALLPAGGPVAGPATLGLFEAIESLPEGSLVLVSFDYDPGTVAEMDALARAILGHLMGRKARILALSLVPEGPTLADMSFGSVVADYPDARYGRHFLNLGYLAGDEAALRTIVLDLRGTVSRDYRAGLSLDVFPAARGLTRIEDVALIIDLAADRRSVRWWVEQVGSRVDVPLAAAVSAPADPPVRPYYASGQLAGLVSGLPGAAEYERLTERPAFGLAAAGAQAAGQLALVALIIAGNVAYWVGRRRGGGHGGPQ